jgi:hypothetical protein
MNELSIPMPESKAAIIWFGSKDDTINMQIPKLKFPRLWFGNKDLTNETTVGDALTSTNMPHPAHALTIAHIRKLLRLAVSAGILPFKIGKSPDLNKRYVLVTSSEAYCQLEQDVEHEALKRRGVIDFDPEPQSQYGSDYKGTVESVMIVVIAELSNHVIENAGGNFAFSMMYGRERIIRERIDRNPYDARIISLTTINNTLT